MDQCECTPYGESRSVWCRSCRQAHLSLRWDTRHLWRPIISALQCWGGQETTAAVALALYVESRSSDRAVSYSRAKTHYDLPHRYRSPLYTYRRVVGAVDLLDALGLIEHDRRVPGDRGWQSAMKPTSELIGLVDSIIADEPLRLTRRRETILLRDAAKNLSDYRETRLTHRMRRDIQEQNEAIASVNLGAMFPFPTPLRRIFNNDFRHGGRFYAEGGGWQTCSKSERHRVIIDGEPVVEIDYVTFHPALAYALKGLPPHPEPYAAPGFERGFTKIAFNVLLNSSSRPGARHTLAHKPDMGRVLLGIEPDRDERPDEFRSRLIGMDAYYMQHAHRRADELIDALMGLHAPIADLFFTGVGLTLQRQDSDIAADVMREMRRRGVTVLPIHDSFLAPASMADLLEQVMIDAAMRMGAIVSCKRSSIVPAG